MRVVRTFVQEIDASPRDVFPLLCPEREKEWLPGWDAQMIFSRSGVAEAGALFRTRDAVWLVTEHEPPRKIAFARWQTNGLVVHIEIGLGERHDGGAVIHICYTYTAISDVGAEELARMSEDTWLKNMIFWQRSMNDWFAKQAHEQAASADDLSSRQAV